MTIALTLLVLVVVLLAQSAVAALMVGYEWYQDSSIDVAESAEALASNGLMLALAGLASAPAAILAIWLCTAVRPGIAPFDYLGLKRFPIGLTVSWLAVLAVYQVAIAMLASAVQAPDNATTAFMMDTFRSAGIKPLLWASVVLLLPVSEELLFRGFMFRGLLHSRLGAVGAVLITSVVWGGIHLQYDLFGMLSIAGMGIVLGLARLATGSTWTTIAMHVAWNGLAVVSTELYLMNSA